MWILLRFVRTAELSGSAFVFDRVYPSLVTTITAIVRRDAHTRLPTDVSLSALALSHIKQLEGVLRVG
jgi:hypothetical protein